jgi:hypothetical protein
VPEPVPGTGHAGIVQVVFMPSEAHTLLEQPPGGPRQDVVACVQPWPLHKQRLTAEKDTVQEVQRPGVGWILLQGFN